MTADALRCAYIVSRYPSVTHTFVLREVFDVSYDEIAEVTGLPLGTVKTRTRSGLARLATRPRPVEELRGLVYALTPRPSDEHLPLRSRPWTLAVIVLVLTLGLNLVFF